MSGTPVATRTGGETTAITFLRARTSALLAGVTLIVLACETAVIGQAAAAAAPGAVQAPPATLVYGNRRITDLRASFLQRTPADRVAAAQSLLDAVAARGASSPVMTRLIEGVMVVAVGGQNVFVIVPADVDELAGETLAQKTAAAAAQLQIAMNEQAELRTPARLAIAAAQSIAVTALLVLLLYAIRRGYRVLAVRLPEGAENRLQKLSAADLQLVRESKAGDLLRRFISFVAGVLAVVLTYFWLTFVLRRFPYTRPWGESLREFLLARFGSIGLAIVQWMPDLLTIAIIIVITRAASRAASLLFEAAEQDRLKLPGLYPETAQPTRRLVTLLLWLFALIASYPYLPGSDSDAFKGVSVFVGLIVSLGSSGIVGQAMSGLTITYSRALRLGDFVKVGDVEGTVTHLGSLSTKIKTLRNEDITIPNSVVVSTPIANFSRFAEADGVVVPATVTIGYGVPWRQVHALLLLAAERASGIKREPAPVVRQTDLGNFCVEYTLFVSPEQPHLRVFALSSVRAQIQDVFNEVGVQIMSPNYEADPDAPKIVPRDNWYAAPAEAPREEILARR